MRKIILSVLMALFAAYTFGQSFNATITTESYYFTKSKKQKTIAWILLAGGTVTAVLGLSQINVAGSDDGEVNNTGGTVLFVTGLVAAVTSIPFFIASTRNKRRGADITLKMQKLPAFGQDAIVSRYYPYISMKIIL